MQYTLVGLAIMYHYREFTAVNVWDNGNIAFSYAERPASGKAFDLHFES